MGQKSKFYVEVRTLHSAVTGSCYVCKVSFSDGEKRIFLVDIGMFQEKLYLDDNEKLTFNPEDVCFTLITHNHVDHVGRLPLLYRRGCTAHAYGSIGTAMALPINLEDSLKIITERSKHLKKEMFKANGRGKYGYRNTTQRTISIKPLYTKEDVKAAEDYFIGIPYGEWTVDERLPAVKFKFFPNAHLPGAVMIWVKIEDVYLEQEINLLFLGDWNEKNVFQGSFDFPEELCDVPIHIVTESTYGGTYKAEIKKSLRENVSRAISDGKVVLLPVISQCRAQEMLWIVKDMKEKGEIPSHTPVYFCGPLGYKYTCLYMNEDFPDVLPEMKTFLPDDLNIVNLMGNCDVSEVQEGIHIVTGGMGANGPSTAYLRTLLPCPNVLIQFSSYCAEETLGRKLREVNYGEEVCVSGVVVKKIADVKFTSELSGHAKADELLEFLSGFKKVKTLMVTHGEFSSKNEFANLLEKSGMGKEVTILDRQHYVRLNPWGILEHKIWSD